MEGQNSYRPGRTNSQRNSTADRAIDVLLLFEESRPVLSAAEIGARLGVSRSTSYRYLYTLRSHGFVEEVDARDGFRLGARILQLARIARRGIGLIDIVLPLMEELAVATRETVLLTRRAGSFVTCIERVESTHPIGLSYERGQVLPIHAGASAKVLIAFEPPQEISDLLSGVRLERFTEHTVADLSTLHAQLDLIRTQGYAVSVEERDRGVCGIAAPIFGTNRKVIAAISVAGPVFRLDLATRAEVIPMVRATADAITNRLTDVDLVVANGRVPG